MLNLVTRYGELDLTFFPSGTDGYPDLARSAIELRASEITVRVAALADIIRSKEAARRGKDLEHLRTLYRALRRQETRRHEG